MGNQVYTIQLPNGETWDVEGPEGATDEQIIAFAKSEVAKRAPGQESRPVKVNQPKATPKSAIEQLADSTAQTVAGLGEGAAALIDIPTNALGGLMALVGSKVGLPQWMVDAWQHPRTIGGTIESFVPQSENKGLEMVRAISQGLGGAASGVGIGRYLARGANGVTGRVGRTMADMPGAQTAAGATGAAAAEGARQGGAPLPIQLLTGIVAGGATPSALRASAGATEAAVNRIVTDEGVRQAAARLLERNSTNSLGGLLSAIDAAPSVQPSGAVPTLAEVTLDPGIAGLQRALGNSTVTGGATINSAVAKNAVRRATAIDRSFGSGDPASLTTAAEARGRQVERQADLARQAIGPDTDPVLAGENIRARLVEAHQGAKARTATAYDAPILQEDPPVRLRPLEREDVTVASVSPPRDISDFQQAAVRGANARLPQQPQSLVQFVRKMGGVNVNSTGVAELLHGGINARTQPGLINRNGRTVDELRELAVEAGFLPEDSTVDDMVNAMTGEYSGQTPRYADAGGAVDYAQAKEARDWWRKQFDERGLDPTKMSDDQWRKFYDDMGGASADGAENLNDPDGAKMGLLMGPFQRTIAALRDRYFGDGAVEAPAYVRSFFDDVLKADEVGLKTLEGWERRAADMASRAPDKQTAAFMASVGRAIGARAAVEGGPERRAALEAARSARREQGTTFEGGAVGKVLDREDYGRFRVPDSQVGAMLIPAGRGGGEAAAQLERAAGQQAAEGTIRTEVRRALDEAGRDPAAVSRVALRFREAIRQVPAVANDVRAARAAAVLQREFERSNLGRLRGANGSDPNVVVAKLMAADDAGQSLRRFSGEIASNRAASEGLRRGIANWISGSTKTTAVDENLESIPSTPKMVSAIEAVLARTRGSTVLTGDQRGVLNSIRRELRQDQFARSANRSAGSDTARNVDAQLGMIRFASMIPGGDKARTVIEVILKVAGRTDMLRDTLAEAMVDPKFAAELLREQHPQRLERALLRIRALNAGATTGSVAATQN